LEIPKRRKRSCYRVAIFAVKFRKWGLHLHFTKRLQAIKSLGGKGVAIAVTGKKSRSTFVWGLLKLGRGGWAEIGTVGFYWFEESIENTSAR